jgi:mannose-6-phosphate isomerase-like protein (cupin superfamily)
VFIMAGRLEITIDEEAVVLEEGDAFTFTASARHAFRAVGEPGPTRVLWVVSPALPDTTRYP